MPVGAGAKVTEEKTWSATILLNVFFLLGVFSFAVRCGGQCCAVPPVLC